jgi:ribokinase
MLVLNFGSLNIDHVYTVDHIAAPGETLVSSDYLVNAGGKGLNQSVALARAGVAVGIRRQAAAGIIRRF